MVNTLSTIVVSVEKTMKNTIGSYIRLSNALISVMIAR